MAAILAWNKDQSSRSALAAFRDRLGAYEALRPERLNHAYFTGPEPQELLYDEIEAIWAAIAERDDWSPFHAKIAAIGIAREAYGLAAATS